ncbi:transcriptional regulator [Candidatus Woesearchaeota archaeon CG08_land_8_20_14_0_20_47_9]|nr:MAG: transcriptional regulator [Candidatus Woesearchaeota archaeon CG08_land_8_20_14_0_20_47_9]
MGQKSVVVNVRLPEEVLSWIDSLIERGIYNSRAEALRDFLRQGLQEEGIL